MARPDSDDNFSAEFWRSQEMLLLRSVITLVGRKLDTGSICREIVHLLSELLGLNRARILWRDLDSPTYRIRHAYGLTAQEIARGVYLEGEGITGTALKNKHLIIIQDIDEEPLFLGRAVKREHLPEGKVAFIAMPIQLPRNEVGLIACHRLRHRSRNLSDDITMLQILSTLIGQLMALHERVEEEKRVLHEHNALLEQALEKASSRYGIIGTSRPLLRVLADLEGVATSSSPVMLEGQPGTGKELFARALHMASSRNGSPFVRINCAAVLERSFEQEFFGYERGAFPTARSRHVGQIEQADGGTLFLDEVGELPLSVQALLLHMLEQGTIPRLGAANPKKVNLRIVSATSTDLKKLIEAGRFRYDLFYRLSVIPLHLPTLQERTEDIPVLSNHFLSQFNQKYERNISLSASAMSLLARHNWPGNVRQLRNAIETVVLLAQKTTLTSSDLHGLLKDRTFNRSAEIHSTALQNRPYLSAASHTKEELVAALKRNSGNKTRTARQLGMTARQLSYRLTVLGIPGVNFS
ncbi:MULTISPECIES: sigma 54-interacting transcriptional regulator [Acetobacter]|uniref:Nif-specific regulatory protein n=2 Tax=Acetobacter TaxID=434 RepID=A0A1Y0V304_9PROT|nr:MULTISPECIES: sigma 54-interacting transcriptional regulator [Acetobacter]ARW12034.1 Nif-specific regulatory protein [Acetobacter ascendens]KAA8384588.1 GAF domain-containing protein [Acetobacter sp. DmW_136]